MRYLFVHQNFPGQFLHVVRRLAAAPGNEVVFITEPNSNAIPNVRAVPYRPPAGQPASVHPAARELDAAVRRAEAVARAAATLKQLGFTPDIVVGHHGWGELLNLRDVWPDAPLLGYFEFYYHTVGIDVNFDPEFLVGIEEHARIRAKNAVNHIALGLGGHGQTPTRWQLSVYPDWAQRQIALLPEGVDLDACKPDAAARRAPLKLGATTIGAREKLVTYVARDLEPYRGFHLMMRAVPHLLRARRDLRVAIVGADGISYGSAPRQGGTWRQALLAELGTAIDPARVLFPGRIPYETYRQMLRRSDAHVYLTYPFVASWSLREALASGCVVIGSDTEPVREFVTDGVNGLLAGFFDPRALAERILHVLDDQPLARRLRTGARAYAERHLDLRDYLAEYEALIGRLTGAAAVVQADEKVVPLSRPRRRSRA